MPVGLFENRVQQYGNTVAPPSIGFRDEAGKNPTFTDYSCTP